MKKLFIKILIALLPVSFAITQFGCSCACGTGNITEVPVETLRKADDFIISKTGQKFFDKYISPDFRGTQYNSGEYKMAYNFVMPEKPFVKGQIEFYTDSLGTVIADKDITGIPECIDNPETCEFNIDSVAAKQIAKENGLPEGIKDWKVSFIWHDDFNRYIWRVVSILSESKGSFGYRGKGKEMIIAPDTGEVLDSYGWQIN